MKHFRLLFSLFVSILGAGATNAQPCASVSSTYHCAFGGHSYDIVREQKSWDSAAACAFRMGGYMAQINNQAEQDSLYHYIANMAGISATYTTVADGGGIAYVWLGGNDKATEGTWKWDGDNNGIGTNFWTGQGAAGTGGGAAVSGAFNNWGGKATGTTNEPDNYAGAQDAVGIALAAWPYGIAGEWNDISAGNLLYYVIEYEPITEVEIMDKGVVSLSVYPNPVGGMLHIGSESSITVVIITDITGNVLKRQVIDRLKHTAINVSDLAKGQYFTIVEFENSSITRGRFIH